MALRSFEFFGNNIEDYFNHIISIRLTNILFGNLRNSPFRNLSCFPKLSKLALENIQSDYLNELLPHLEVHHNLSSLVLVPIDSSYDWQQLLLIVFRLRNLEYFKVSAQRHLFSARLPVATNLSSSIKHLILDVIIPIRDLNHILSYLPHLQRLSCTHLVQSNNQSQMPLTFLSNVLTHISFHADDFSVELLEAMFTKVFNQLQVFRFSTTSNVEYLLDSNRWQQFIISHMPNLRIFDIKLSITNYFSPDEFRKRVEYFKHLFWCQRRWFFEYEYKRSTAKFRSIVSPK